MQPQTFVSLVRNMSTCSTAQRYILWSFKDQIILTMFWLNSELGTKICFQILLGLWGPVPHIWSTNKFVCTSIQISERTNNYAGTCLVLWIMDQWSEHFRPIAQSNYLFVVTWLLHKAVIVPQLTFKINLNSEFPISCVSVYIYLWPRNSLYMTNDMHWSHQ